MRKPAACSAKLLLLPLLIVNFAICAAAQSNKGAIFGSVRDLNEALVSKAQIKVVSAKNGEVRETVVTLGKQLSRRWYVGYERGVNSTTGTWQLIYRAAQRFTLRAQSGADNALDAIWTWRWN